MELAHIVEGDLCADHVEGCVHDIVRWIRVTSQDPHELEIALDWVREARVQHSVALVVGAEDLVITAWEEGQEGDLEGQEGEERSERRQGR